MYDNFIDDKVVRRRIMSQGRHILESIIEAFNTGMLEDPKHAANLCTLFLLCAEGKVTASFDEISAATKWSLTEDWTKHLREIEQSILRQNVDSKIIKGPWKNSVDKKSNT